MQPQRQQLQFKQSVRNVQDDLTACNVYIDDQFFRSRNKHIRAVFPLHFQQRVDRGDVDTGHTAYYTIVVLMVKNLKSL